MQQDLTSVRGWGLFLLPMPSTYTNQSEKELATEIYDQFLFSKRLVDNIHQRMNEQEEMYRSFLDPLQYPHQARVFDPRVFRVIETVTPRMVANEPTGSFYPTEEGDVVTTQILNALIKYDWRRAEMFQKLVMFVKSMLIFGTAFGRTYWDYRTTERTRMKAKTIHGRLVWTPENTEKVETVEFDGPNFEVLNIYDCFPDPNATSLDNMRWFIYRTFKTFEELKHENDTRGVEYYKNLDELEARMKGSKDQGNTGGSDRPESLNYREHRRTMLSTEDLVGQDDSNPEIVILRRFTREGWCDYVPEYDLVIREVENPYFHGELPIIYGVDYPYPGELYGMGEIEPIDRIQRAINAVLNQRLDNVQLTLRTMWKVKKNSNVDMHTLISAPGNIITTGDMDAVEPVQIPDVTGPTFVQTMNYLTSALQNGSGITDYTIGTNSESNVANETATGVRLIQQEANAQFKLKIQLFNHMVIRRVANQWKDLRIQYTTEAQKVRILGRDEVKFMKEKTELAKIDMSGEPIAPGELDRQGKLQISQEEDFAFLHLLPEDIQPSIVGDYDFIATVSSESIMDPQALQANYFAAIDRVKDPAWTQGLAQQGKMLNYVSQTEKIFEKLNQGIEVNDILVDMPQMPVQDPNMMPDVQQQLEGFVNEEIPLPEPNGQPIA